MAGKKPGGDNAKYHEWRTEEKLMLIKCWARDGLAEVDIAANMGIAQATLIRWKSLFPEIAEAIREGKEIVDYKVENALLKRCLGYEYEEVKTIISGKPDKDGNRQMRIEKTKKQMAPDVTAIAIWLNNRKPDQWKRNRDNSLYVTEDDNTITINVVKAKKESDGSKGSKKGSDE